MSRGGRRHISDALRRVLSSFYMQEQSYSYIFHLHVWFGYAGTILLLHFPFACMIWICGNDPTPTFSICIMTGICGTNSTPTFSICMYGQICVMCIFLLYSYILHEAKKIIFLQPYYSNLLHQCTIKVAHRSSHPNFLFFALLQYNYSQPSYIPTLNWCQLQ